MQLNVTFRHLDPSEALKAHVRGKLEHVERYLDRPTEAYAVLHVENLQHHAEITVKAGRFLLRGTAKSPDMYASIDAAADRIERQLKKHKEKLHGAHKANATPHHNGQEAVEIHHEVLDVLDHPDRPSRRLVKSTRFEAKPMSLDEAILQLDLLDSHFFVFQNEKDGGLNVVYRRDDGNVGLIEAKAG